MCWIIGAVFFEGLRDSVDSNVARRMLRKNTPQTRCLMQDLKRSLGDVPLSRRNISVDVSPCLRSNPMLGL